MWVDSRFVSVCHFKDVNYIPDRAKKTFSQNDAAMLSWEAGHRIELVCSDENGIRVKSRICGNIVSGVRGKPFSAGPHCRMLLYSRTSRSLESLGAANWHMRLQPYITRAWVFVFVCFGYTLHESWLFAMGPNTALR